MCFYDKNRSKTFHKDLKDYTIVKIVKKAVP